MKLMTYVKRVASTALLAVTAVGMLNMAVGTASAATPGTGKPTIILVHGAFADSSSWDGVISRLQADGYTVIAAPDPLRSLKSDSNYVSGIVKNTKGPVVLVGHSYGGSIITNAATGADNVKALVYVAAYAPEAGENAFDLTGKFPGSILPDALAPPIALADGAHDLFVQQGKFRSVFAADVPEKQAELMAATQRPVTDAALKGASGAPAWKIIPSWFVYGSADKVIPPAAHAFMAQRAGAKEALVVKDAPHLVMVSHPAVVARLIEKAAAAEETAKQD
ncbi:alpha/beta fold hydrolase [Roseixanthobacter finlandensis]|uniref:alpha/beta fold hydrolase n=1 Tax=Roseixanthobacter finlandensis TaxID=3119922 RepID=UPI00372CF2C6